MNEIEISWCDKHTNTIMSRTDSKRNELPCLYCQYEKYKEHLEKSELQLYRLQKEIETAITQEKIYEKNQLIALGNTIREIRKTLKLKKREETI